MWREVRIFAGMKRIYVLADLQGVRADLLPITYTRVVGDILVGIDSIADKWSRHVDGEWYVEPEADYLAELYADRLAPEDGDRTLVAANVLPDATLAAAVEALLPGEQIVDSAGLVVARRISASGPAVAVEYPHPVRRISQLYDIFLLNGDAIRADFASYAHGEQQTPSDTNTVIGDAGQLYIAPDATVEGAVINVKTGPVYIGPGAEVMEGALLRGPIAICAHATVNMGTRIYPDTTIGRWCKVGGELNNVVMLGYSNKAHDGFLGNAVIGAWCNIGAGATASNLKNDYTPIRLWNYPTGRFLRTGLQFCGLIMGDHSKAGINTMFNTATVLGVGVNIHGSGFPRNFVPSFSEGSTAGYTEVSMSKFCGIAERMMARRGLPFTEAHARMFEAIRHAAEEYK